MISELNPSFLLWAAVGGLALIFYLLRSRQQLPPGPKTLPFIGNLHLLTGKSVHNKLLHWAHQYGEMFTLWLFNQPVIFINSKDAIREALLKKPVEFADRPQSFTFDYFTRGGKVIGFGRFSERWKNQKKIAATSLRMYGEGMQKLENISQEVLQDFITHLKSTEGQLVAVGSEVQKAIINVITSLIFGRQFPWDDPDFAVLNEVSNNIPGISISRSILDAIPWIRHFVPLEIWKIVKANAALLNDFFDRHLAVIKANYDPENIKCFAEAIYRYTLEQKPGMKLLEYDMFVMTVFGVFLAGFATTSAAMSAFILLCLHHPEVEKKLTAEIDTVLGQDRLPSLEDKKNMPYLEACILEVLRYTSHVPLALPHTTYTDTIFRGYHIPKGTLVFMHLNNLHHDENEWTDPWVFRPERFIEPETGEVVPPGHPVRQSFLGFGAGRRVCIGEALARNRLFLFIAGVYQKFKILPEEGATLPTCDPRKWRFSLLLNIPNYKVSLVPRQ